MLQSKNAFPNKNFFGIERNVGVAAGLMFLLGLGEELWKKFLPKYLEALQAGVSHIGWFGALSDFLDAVYQYPGGWLADRLGRGHAFVIFIALAIGGYFIYLCSFSWQLVFLGLIFAMGWQSMASPALFAIIGDTLPKHQRTLGFTVQAILKRVPIIIAPIAGGMLLAEFGVVSGVRAGLAITLLFAALALAVARTINVPLPAGSHHGNLPEVWRSFPPALKRLLLSDVIIRMCEGMAGVFLVLYATNVVGISLAEYGVLVAVQVTTSILVYLPAAKFADCIGRKPFVIATFLCFALFPLAHVWASSFIALLFVYIVGGLREMGEPARKAMIVDFAAAHARGRTVGLYYLIRGLAITPSALLGSWLWQVSPMSTFLVAGILGMLGTLVFAATVAEQYAS